MRGNIKSFITEMSGWICLTLTLTVCIGILLEKPIDTQFFTLAGNILMAYVVQGVGKILGNGDRIEEHRPIVKHGQSLDLKDEIISK